MWNTYSGGSIGVCKFDLRKIFKQSLKDITNEWKKISPGHAKDVKNLVEYEINGTVYKADGKCILLDHNEEEKDIANIISKKYGKSVKLIPRVLYPQKIKTPDYLIEYNL